MMAKQATMGMRAHVLLLEDYTILILNGHLLSLLVWPQCLGKFGNFKGNLSGKWPKVGKVTLLRLPAEVGHLVRVFY